MWDTIRNDHIFIHNQVKDVFCLIPLPFSHNTSKKKKKKIDRKNIGLSCIIFISAKSIVYKISSIRKNNPDKGPYPFRRKSKHGRGEGQFLHDIRVYARPQWL